MSGTPSNPPPARPWPCRMRRLTPDEVLTHLRAYCRDEVGVSEECVSREVVHNAPLQRLVEIDAGYLFPAEHDWEGFGPYFGLELDQEWHECWQRGATIADLCTDLASRIEVPVFEPMKMLGRECETAGAFLAIRNMLAADGADVWKLGPSSPVAPYLARHAGVFDRVRLASCGRLPRLIADAPALFFGCWLFFLAGLSALFTWGFGRLGIAWPVSLMFSLAFAGTISLGLAVYSRRAAQRIPRINDFRQLVYTLLGRTPRTA